MNLARKDFILPEERRHSDIDVNNETIFAQPRPLKVILVDRMSNARFCRCAE